MLTHDNRHQLFLISPLPVSRACPNLTTDRIRETLREYFAGLSLEIHTYTILSTTSDSYRDLIVECLDDRDDSIRLRALDLISGMVTKKNLVEIVKKLMLHMDQSDSTSERLIYMFHANHSNLNSNVVIIRCNGPYAMDITATLMYVYAHSFLTLVIGIYSRGQKKVPFHLRATIVLQYERLRSVLRNHSVLRLLIQQLLLPGVSG